MIDKERVFNYLDDLRVSGVTNMFGAPAYVRHYFGAKEVSQSEAINLVVEWMETFDKRHPDGDK